MLPRPCAIWNWEGWWVTCCLSLAEVLRHYRDAIYVLQISAVSSWPGLEAFLAELGLRIIASPALFGKEIYRGRNISDGHIQTKANPLEPKLDQLAEAMDLGQRFLGRIGLSLSRNRRFCQYWRRKTLNCCDIFADNYALFRRRRQHFHGSLSFCWLLSAVKDDFTSSNFQLSQEK
jgi:hypothetical protein